MAWKDNLLKSINDPNLIKFKDDKVVIIEDLYPKSECHYLVIPYEDILNIQSLQRQHLSTLYYMDELARNFAYNFKGKNMWLGYHAKPSMNRLHLHLISDDFNGQGLKHKKHYNSFTTPFFIASSKVIHDVKQFGRVLLPSDSECDIYLKTALKCHKCKYNPINMPTLKLHLLTHL
uniref:HIT domain-containing protein n=1 Tax=Clastoptera arizonana TaxID=38151 RepID=A0A1B6CDU7_9HEMI